MHDFDLEIYRDEKARGLHFHKAPGIKGISKTKAQAMRDISKECETGFYVKNYVLCESLVLQLSELKLEIINI